MTGKEILLKTLKRESAPRTPWMPYVGVHGGRLIGATASDYLRDPVLVRDGLLKAHELYRPDGLPITFDLQMEPEILGCALRWADDSPPAVTSHPLAEGKGIDDLPAFDTAAGRMGVSLEALGQVKARIGGEVALYGLVCGPLTLALHLRGDELFLDMYDEEEEVEALLGYCASVCRATSEAYLKAGADVIAVVDPMVSQISPDHYRQFVSAAQNTVFEAVRSDGGLGSLFVCGDATRNIGVMCETACDNISVDENVDLRVLGEAAAKAGKSFGGNIRLTTALLLGTELDSAADAARCLEEGGGEGFVLAPGCDLPFATPEANLQAVARVAHDPYERDVARQAAASAADDFADIELPDYGTSRETIVDVVTLDSGSCAPCQYMMQAAEQAAQELGEAVLVREHKIKNRAGIGHMVKLGVTKVPSICIGGRVAFESLIPDRPTLVKAIREAKN
jgi:uroporphyrinogen decarboxylase